MKTRSIIIFLIAFIIKAVVFAEILIFALEKYNKEAPLYLQSVLFWLLIVLPLFMGYESLISIIFRKWNKKEVEK